MTPPQYPAIERRLYRLQQLFARHFPAERDSGCCCWVLQEDGERRMIEAFVATESSEGAVFSDLFLDVSGAADPGADWAASFADDLLAQWKDAAPVLAEHNAPDEPWNAPHGVTDLPGLLDFALRVAGSFPNLHGRTVLYLNPLLLHDDGGFAAALHRLLREGLPQGLILMVSPPAGSVLDERLREFPDLHLTRIVPELDMDGALREVLDAAPADDPEGQFRRLYHDMCVRGGERDFAGMRAAGGEALRLAESQVGWEATAATVLCAQGALLLSHSGRYEESIDFFRRAVRAARVAVASEHPGGPAVLLQALSYEAMGLYYQKEYAAAGEAYERAAAEAGEAGGLYDFNAYEALRMATEAYRAAGLRERAWATGIRALDLADTLPKDQAAGSTLPYLGTVLLEVAGRPEEEQLVRRRLTGLVGAEWAP